MTFEDGKSLLDLAKLKLNPKSNCYMCELCGLQIETISKSFFNTDINELEFIDLLNTQLIYFRIFTFEVDKGETPEIFTSKNLIHFAYKGKHLCQLSPIEAYTILKTNTSFLEIKKRIKDDDTS